MNSRIFAKSFSDIKKQSQTETKKKLQKSNKDDTPQSHADTNAKPINGEGHPDQQKQQPLHKPISKADRSEKQKLIKKWKNDLYANLKKKEDSGKQDRIILIDNTTQKDILKALSAYRIYIEEISDSRVLLADAKKAKQCLQILVKAGFKADCGPAKAGNESEAVHNDVTKKPSIFERIQ